MTTTPYIDPNVRFLAHAKLKKMSVSQLASLQLTYVIQDDNDAPVAVLVSYETFQAMQTELTTLRQELAERVAPLQSDTK